MSRTTTDRAQRGARTGGGEPGRPYVLVQRLLGRWVNTDYGCQGVAELEVRATQHEGALVAVHVQVLAREAVCCGSGICDLYECTEEDEVFGVAGLMTVRCEGEKAERELQLRLNKGILCVMSWVRPDSATYNSYVVRQLLRQSTANEVV